MNTQNKDRQTVESVSLNSLFPGFTFPPRPICDFLVESYRKSVHWFMMLFHEASFESEYKKVMDSQVASPRQLGIVVLFLTVFTMGARYTTDDEAWKPVDQIWTWDHSSSKCSKKFKPTFLMLSI